MHRCTCTALAHLAVLVAVNAREEATERLEEEGEKEAKRATEPAEETAGTNETRLLTELLSVAPFLLLILFSFLPEERHPVASLCARDDLYAEDPPT